MESFTLNVIVDANRRIIYHFYNSLTLALLPLSPHLTVMTRPSPDSEPSPPSEGKLFHLEAEHELRFEIPSDATNASLTLETGAAELFGIELARKRSYPLPPSFNAAVFTWHGATITLGGSDGVMAYTATDTPMPSYVCAHAVLQSIRDNANATQSSGPRVVVVGPRDCGKSTLVSLLAAYCIKVNGMAVIVDADPSGCGAAGVVAGSIAVSVVKHLDLDVGGLVHEKILPLMVGHSSPRDNQAVTQARFDAMGHIVDEVLASPLYKRNVGCIVDTSGDVDTKDGTDLVIHVAKAIRADVVFVLGAERLHASVSATFENSATETVLLAKSGGVVSRDNSSRLQMQSSRVRRYFYGPDNSFKPFTMTIDLAEVSIFKMGGIVSVIPDSVLPAGAESSLDPLKPTPVTTLEDLLHRVLGVSQADCEENIAGAPLYGFIHVIKIDVDRSTFTVLSPSPGKLPSRFLVAGDLKWIE